MVFSREIGVGIDNAIFQKKKKKKKKNAIITLPAYFFQNISQQI